VGIGSPPGLLRSLCMYIHTAIKKYSEDIQESDEPLPLVICDIRVTAPIMTQCTYFGAPYCAEEKIGCRIIFKIINIINKHSL